MGLIGGIARTAVVAGTFTAVSNRVSRRQAKRWAQKDQSAYPPQQYAPQQYAAQYAPPPPPPPPPSAASNIDVLTKMAQLHDQGVRPTRNSLPRRRRSSGSGLAHKLG